MRSPRPPAQHWLSLRIRILCVLVLALSMFLPRYSPDVQAAPQEFTDQEDGSIVFIEDGFLMKTSSLTEQGTRSAFSEGIIHTVEPNESIAGIAKSAGIKAETVRWANNLADTATVKPGQKLLILPVDGVLHTVKRGQNLSSIAELYSVPAEKISEQNKLKGGYLLAGQQLIVPGGKPIVDVPKVIISSKPPVVVPPGTKPPATPAVPAKTYVIEPTYGVLQNPCDCYYTQYFSPGHFGVDMQHKGGSPIFAAEAGTVIRADYGWDGGYGNVIEIDHGNGLVTLYGHNKELYVKKGDVVTRGQVISFMGNTGQVHGPTGIHLHFEVRVNGNKKNPTLYLK
ncbi:MAG TPA: peptidoglycan DD-metalloendopeptidase family protein [Candidatus Peribacteria bacterium]|nr:peptidoglycan DD-metalloendopeptidase family protein [Candidatus Peribacteria bacterium]